MAPYGPTVTIWNGRSAQIDVAFHDDYLGEMESAFGRTDWAALAVGHGAYAVEKPWKFTTEIAGMLLTGELPEEIADYRCHDCAADFDSAAGASAHRCD